MDGVQAANAKALQIAEDARSHKKSAEFHRRQAANARARLAAFVRQCNERGIQVVIDGQTLTNAQGGTSGDNHRSEGAGQTTGTQASKHEEDDGEENADAEQEQKHEEAGGPASRPHPRRRTRKRRTPQAA